MALHKVDDLVARHIARLEVENDELRERVRQLEEAALGPEVPPSLGLSPSEGKMLALLCRREMVTKEAAMVMLYGGRGGGELLPDETILNVLVCRIRRRVKEFGIEILTIWGRGWRMTPEGRKIMKGLMNA